MRSSRCLVHRENCGGRLRAPNTIENVMGTVRAIMRIEHRRDFPLAVGGRK